MEAADYKSASPARPVSPTGGDSILLGPGAALPAPYYDMRAPEEPPAANVLTATAHAIRRRWFPVTVLGVVLGGAAAAAFWCLTQTQYTAVARVIVPAQESILPGGEAEGGPVADFEFKKRSQMQLVTSPMVLLSALASPNVVSLPIVKAQENDDNVRLAWLRSCVSVSFPGNAEIMELHVRCEDQKAASELATAIRAKYIGSQELELRERVEQIETLKKERDLFKRDYRDAQASLISMEEQGGAGVPLTLEEQEKARQVQLYWNERFQVEQEIWDKEENLKQLAASADGKAPSIVSDEELKLYLESTDDYQKLVRKAELLNKEIELAASQYSGETYERIVAAAQQQIKDSETRVTELADKVRKALEREKLRSHVVVSPALLENEIAKLKARKAVLQGLIDENAPRSNGPTIPQVEIEMKRIEVANLHARYARVQKQVEHAEMAKLSDITRQQAIGIRPDGQVYVHAEADERRKLMQSCAAGGAVFVAVSALILLFDLRRRKLNDASDVSSILQLPVLGTVPLLRGKGPKRMQESARLAEAVDGVAATLLCRTAGCDHRLVMISSAMAGEGKTTLAANLATSLAAAGRRTLLVDFDLRRPMLHQVYQVPIGPGLGELLTGRDLSEFGDYLQETMTDNLWLIPAGAKRHGALAELSDERVAELFREFKEHFEFIIVDGPPVLPVVDTRLVARHADGVVISMLRDLSELPKVKSACQLLQSYRVQILGGVVIGASGDVYYGYPPDRFSSTA